MELGRAGFKAGWGRAARGCDGEDVDALNLMEVITRRVIDGVARRRLRREEERKREIGRGRWARLVLALMGHERRDQETHKLALADRRGSASLTGEARATVESLMTRQ